MRVIDRNLEGVQKTLWDNVNRYTQKVIRSGLFLFCAGALTACPGSENSAAAIPKADSQPILKPKALIVYLSRTQNTQTIAAMIHQKTGGVLIPLELVTPYPTNYQAIVNQVEQENITGYLPSLKTQIEDIHQYDVIFVGFPTWDMQLPPPIKSFVQQYDLNGKIVVPFNTNAGYGLGQSISQLEQYCRGCQLLKSIEIKGGIERDGILFVMEGEKAKQAKVQVEQWLTDLETDNTTIQNLIQQNTVQQP